MDYGAIERRWPGLGRLRHDLEPGTVSDHYVLDIEVGLVPVPLPRVPKGRTFKGWGTRGREAREVYQRAVCS